MFRSCWLRSLLVKAVGSHSGGIIYVLEWVENRGRCSGFVLPFVPGTASLQTGWWIRLQDRRLPWSSVQNLCRPCSLTWPEEKHLTVVSDVSASNTRHLLDWLTDLWLPSSFAFDLFEGLYRLLAFGHLFLFLWDGRLTVHFHSCPSFLRQQLWVDARQNPTIWYGYPPKKLKG